MPFEYFFPLKEHGWRGGSTGNDGVWSTYVCLCMCFTGVSRQNPQGSGIFFRFFSMRLAKIKTPDPGGFRKYHALYFVSGAEKINERFVLSSFLGYL